MSPSDSTPPAAPVTLRRPRRKQSRRRRWWPAAVIALVLIGAMAIAARVVTQPLPASSEATGIATPAKEPTKTPSATPSLTYYRQIGPPAGSPLKAIPPMSIAVSDIPEGTSLPKAPAGISLEATDLGDKDLNAENASMVKLLKDLDQPVLRFGGNSADRRFFWTSTNETLPGSYKGDSARPVRAVGPADLARVNGLLVATGSRISLTVDLGHYNPGRAADMMKHATAVFGDRLVSVTIGNEPNGFVYNGVRKGGYSIKQYVAELKEYARAIHAVAPSVPVSGPGAYDQKWWKPFIDADIPQKKILSFHNYPLYSCDGRDPNASPKMVNLMSRSMHERAAGYQLKAVAAGRAGQLQTWLPETGIAACPGSNETSKTHASALWTADYALNAAWIGVSQIGFHSSLMSCKGGPPMSTLCSAGPYPEGSGDMSPRANFFGISILSGLGGGKFLKADVQGGGLSFGYALKHPDGSTTVVVVNENNPQTAAQTAVRIQLPGQPRTGTMSQLTGPSFQAQDQTLIDGAKKAPVPAAKRLTAPGFKQGSAAQTIRLTAGTVTVLKFTY